MTVFVSFLCITNSPKPECLKRHTLAISPPSVGRLGSSLGLGSLAGASRRSVGAQVGWLGCLVLSPCNFSSCTGLAQVAE